MTDEINSVSSLISQIYDRELEDKSWLICKILGKSGFFGARYKDDKIKIKIITGWDSATYKIWWEGTLILDHHAGAWELLGSIPETRLYRPDWAEGYYEHLQSLHEKAIKIKELQKSNDNLKRFGVAE